VLLLCVSALSFFLADAAPGDFLDELRLDPQISALTIAGLRSRYALDQPLAIRYVRWLTSLTRGEGGFSFAYRRPAAAIVWPRARNTLILSAAATLLAWLVAIPAGVWSAATKWNVRSSIVNTWVSSLQAIPELVLAMLFLLFALRSGYFPLGGADSLDGSSLSFWGQSRDLAFHLFLPSICLGLSLLPLLFLHVRSTMINVIDSPFITAARAYGVPRHRLVWRHALPAALNPLISLFGFSVGVLISSSLLVEGTFSWPGLGQLLIEAIMHRDVFLVVDATTLGALFLIGGNLLADGLLVAADPRIRMQ
jgi:peptide/nickel transport system permease protein